MDEPRLDGPIPATSIEFSTRFSNRNATRLQLVPRSKYYSCVIDPLEFKIRILQPSNLLGQGTLGLSLPGPSSLLAHLPVPALPPLGVCRGGGPCQTRCLSKTVVSYAQRLTTLAEMRGVTLAFGGFIITIFEP